MSKNSLLIITSTYPRKNIDTDPPFMRDLSVRLAKHFSTYLICPDSPDCTRINPVPDLEVVRFRYFLKNWERLAYGTGILNKLNKHKAYYLLVPFFIIGEMAAVIRIIKNKDIRLINPHWLIPQGIVAVLARAICRKQTPVLCTLHGGDLFSLNHPFLQYLKRYTIKRMDKLLVVSQAMKQRLVAFGAKPDRIHVIPMGVDLHHHFTPGITPKKPQSVLFVGRLVEKKGLTYLINAFTRVVHKYPEAKLTIVGKGPEEAALKQQVLNQGIEKKVVFLGALDHTALPTVYREHELAVFPFIEDRSGDMEGFGLVMVEAMGCGCAVIASDVPAVHDVIIDQQTGLLCTQKNTDRLFKSISVLFEAPELRQKLAQQGREYALARFDWSATERKYQAVFTETIEKNKN